jgi:GntR family transcriptional repressor for pyruvate dehydrogenase complex
VIARETRPALEALFGAGDVAPSRLGEAVIERLTEAIVEGRLKPGDALPSEGSIAATFGVSKPIAREALRELAAMGVVQVQQGKISRVRAVGAGPLARFYRFAVGTSRRGMEEAVELRRLIEPQAARLSALRRSETQMAAFEAILARMGAAMGDTPRWIEADLAFHAHLGAMAGNRLLALQLEALEPIIRRMMERFNAREPRTPAAWRDTLGRHAAVVGAVRAGDAAASEAAMLAHFSAAETAIAELFVEGRRPAARLDPR